LWTRTRTVLDIFNCSPTIPPDGHQYLQVVFVRCGTGLQARLMPIAVVYLLAYTIGYPTVVMYVILKNKLLIMEDQVRGASQCTAVCVVVYGFACNQLGPISVMHVCCGLVGSLQVLRAKETGDTRLSNPHCYDFRKMYQVL
jgi:hypothetical protein